MEEQTKPFTLEDLTEPEKGQDTKLNMGTLYDMNKSIIANQKPLSNYALEQKKSLVYKFLNETDNNYYMMLCHERRDYTILALTEKTANKKNDFINCLIDECLKNRGEVKAIDLTEDGAIEIWITQEDEDKNDTNVYYFFPYDAAIVMI